MNEPSMAPTIPPTTIQLIESDIPQMNSILVKPNPRLLKYQALTHVATPQLLKISQASRCRLSGPYRDQIDPRQSFRAHLQGDESLARRRPRTAPGST